VCGAPGCLLRPKDSSGSRRVNGFAPFSIPLLPGFPRDEKKLAHLQLTAAQYLASLEHLCAVCAAFAMVPCVPCLPCLLCLLCLPCFSSGMVSCGACVFVSTRYAARRKMFQDIVFQNYARVAVPCVPPSSAPAGATCDLCAVCRM
jgi:hypothetical protein